MATIVFTHDVNDVVYHVTDEFVRKGIVKEAESDTTVLGTTKIYTVQYSDAQQGSADVEEIDLFDDIDAALAAYKLLIQ